MPTCKGCGTTFPNRINIDGKMHNMQRRKFCLTCSPFGAHNTSSIKYIAGGNICTCRICNRLFNYKRTSGGTRRTCNSCLSNKDKRNKKQILVEYKRGKCFLCGYNTYISALSFHHLNPVNKDFNISGSHCRNIELLKLEVDKCVLVCMNCHAEIHSNVVIV
jgi:hypothetical protein